MTLIVAADAQDHLILAGDHCAVLSRMSTGEPTERIVRNYRKVYPWKYGAIAASGDVILLAYWWRMFMKKDIRGSTVDLLHLAADAKRARNLDGIPPEKSTANIFCTLPGENGFALHTVYIGTKRVSCDVIKPISSVFSMREGGLDETASEKFVNSLRPSFFFTDPRHCERYNTDLLRDLFTEQAAQDSLVTASFDMILLQKESGRMGFWKVAQPAKQLFELQVCAHCSSPGCGKILVDPKKEPRLAAGFFV